MTLPKSHFTEHLVRLNTLSFSKWVFEPGMLFHSEMQRWETGDAAGVGITGLIFTAMLRRIAPRHLI